MQDDYGCRDGAVVRALASHQCDLSLIPTSGVICGLSLFVLYSASERFSPGNLVSPAPGVQGWRSSESTRLPPMWPRFDSRTRRHMWVEFVGSLLSTKRFSPGTPVSPLLKNQHLT